MIDPDSEMNEEQLKKARKTKEAKQIFDEYVNDTLNRIKTERGYADGLQNEIYNTIKLHL